MDNIFSDLSILDKAGILGRGLLIGAKQTISNPQSILGHGKYPERLSSQLQYQYPELGNVRQNRTPLDVAINYGGGYDWAARSKMNQQDAQSLAKAYQLADYIKYGLLMNPEGQQDSVQDYLENVAGINKAIQDNGAMLNNPSLLKKSADYAKTKATKEPKFKSYK
jgi:hypothetical protein